MGVRRGPYWRAWRAGKTRTWRLKADCAALFPDTRSNKSEVIHTPANSAAAGHIDPLLAAPMSAAYIRAVPTIDLAADELAAVAAEIRRAIEDDRFPHAPRLDPLRAALGKFEAALEPTPHPKAPPPAKSDKRAPSAKAPEPKISPGFKLGRLPPDR